MVRWGHVVALVWAAACVLVPQCSPLALERLGGRGGWGGSGRRPEHLAGREDWAEERRLASRLIEKVVRKVSMKRWIKERHACWPSRPMTEMLKVEEHQDAKLAELCASGWPPRPLSSPYTSTRRSQWAALADKGAEGDGEEEERGAVDEGNLLSVYTHLEDPSAPPESRKERRAARRWGDLRRGDGEKDVPRGGIRRLKGGGGLGEQERMRKLKIDYENSKELGGHVPLNSTMRRANTLRSKRHKRSLMDTLFGLDEEKDRSQIMASLGKVLTRIVFESIAATWIVGACQWVAHYMVGEPVIILFSKIILPLILTMRSVGPLGHSAALISVEVATFGIRLAKCTFGSALAGSIVHCLRHMHIIFRRPVLPVLVACVMRVYRAYDIIWVNDDEEEEDEDLTPEEQDVHRKWEAMSTPVRLYLLVQVLLTEALTSGMFVWLACSPKKTNIVRFLVHTLADEDEHVMQDDEDQGSTHPERPARIEGSGLLQAHRNGGLLHGSTDDNSFSAASLWGSFVQSFSRCLSLCFGGGIRREVGVVDKGVDKRGVDGDERRGRDLESRREKVLYRDNADERQKLDELLKRRSEKMKRLLRQLKQQRKQQQHQKTDTAVNQTVSGPGSGGSAVGVGMGTKMDDQVKEVVCEEVLKQEGMKGAGARGSTVGVSGSQGSRDDAAKQGLLMEGRGNHGSGGGGWARNATALGATGQLRSGVDSPVRVPEDARTASPARAQSPVRANSTRRSDKGFYFKFPPVNKTAHQARMVAARRPAPHSLNRSTLEQDWAHARKEGGAGSAAEGPHAAGEGERVLQQLDTLKQIAQHTQTQEASTTQGARWQDVLTQDTHRASTKGQKTNETILAGGTTRGSLSAPLASTERQDGLLHNASNTPAKQRAGTPSRSESRQKMTPLSPAPTTPTRSATARTPNPSRVGFSTIPAAGRTAQTQAQVEAQGAVQAPNAQQQTGKDKGMRGFWSGLLACMGMGVNTPSATAQDTMESTTSAPNNDTALHTTPCVDPSEGGGGGGGGFMSKVGRVLQVGAGVKRESINSTLVSSSCDDAGAGLLRGSSNVTLDKASVLGGGNAIV